MTSISSQSQKGLGELLQASDQTLMKSKQEFILRAFRFEGMGNRFHDVETAHETTFEWLLEAHGHKHSDSTFKSEARERFTDWLQYGSGIFHISGKPGAGKSTLMKFLCKNGLTRRYLEKWSNGKALVFGKAFFWRLGNDNQKSLVGLICTLLHDVLSAAPDLIPIILPSQWRGVNTYSGSMITLEPDEIDQAFDNLLTNQVTFEGRRIVFFIDGLDEYKGRHSELVKKFFNWLSLNPENLKICVSSREWNEFTVGFAECPKLRIHECTHEDITAFVSHRIKTYSEDLDPFNQDSLELLVEKITAKAEGVFLWVRLALNATEDGILNGDSVLDLEAKLNAFPKELGDLYQHLFDSIHVSDRRKVFETLRMASHMGSDRGLRLLLFWFLNEAIADHNFATTMPITEASEENLRKVLKTTQRQIYGRCKGILEVYPLRPPSPPSNRLNRNTPQELDTFTPLPSDGEVRFMHSTAYEFLDQDHIKQEIDHTVGHVDIFHRICQTFLASIKFANEAWYFHHHVEGKDSQFNNELNDILQFALKRAKIFSRNSETRQSQFLTFLNQTEIVSMARLRSTYQYISHHLRFSSKREFGSSPAYVHTSAQTHIISLAASHCMHEFLRGNDIAYLEYISGRCGPVIPGNPDTFHGLALLLFSRHPDLKFSGFTYDRICDTLELCFSRGISPNHATQVKGPTLFDYMLMLLISYGYQFLYDIDTPLNLPINIYPVRLLELCLRYGARSQLKLCFGPIYRHKLTNKVYLNAGFDLGPAFNTDEMIHRWEIKSTVSTSPIALLAKQRDWVVTLRDLAELWAPDHYMILQDLLDRNNGGDMTSSQDMPWPERLHLPGDESKDAWRSIEQRKDLYQWQGEYTFKAEDYEEIRIL